MSNSLCTGMLLCWMPVATGLQSDADEEAAVAAVGKRFAEQLANADYREASAMISEHISMKLTPRALEQMWTNASHDLGAFVRVAETKPQRSGRKRWVDVECDWERGRRTLQAIVGEDKKIVGLQWIPLDVDAPAIQPPPPRSSKNAVEVAVTVGTDPWTLPGTLTVPRSGPVKAALVIVHDVNFADRDGTAGMNKSYRDLAIGLAEKGVATLRYDKRGLRYAEKLSGQPATVKDDVLDDALAALSLLRSREETSAAPIFIAGHGRGGTLAPYVGAADGKLAGLILLAGIARSNEEALRDQLEYEATIYESGDSAKNALASMEEKLNALRARTLKPEEDVYGAKAGFWYDLCDRDADAAIAQAAALSCRILVLQPGRDYESTPEDLALWRSGLRTHPAATFQALDDLNHWFAKGRGKATPQEKNTPKEFDPNAIALIADWCAKAAGTSTKPAP